MENCAFIDIFTTQNELYGKNNCPIQFYCDVFSIEDILNDKRKFIISEAKKTFNIIPDEEISIAGYLNSKIKLSEIKTDTSSKTLSESLELIYTLLNRLVENNVYICGYNHLNYDLKILNEHFKRVTNKEPISFDKNHIVDIMDIAEVFIPIEKIGNYSMDSVFMYLFDDMSKFEQLKMDKSTSTDVKITKLIMLKLFNIIFGDKTPSFSELLSKTEDKRTTIDYFNFGKYKGLKYKTVFDLDKTYLNWILNNKAMNESKPTVIKNIKKLYNTAE